MKVMKFGGTSVGSPESLQQVKSIIINEEEPVIVVVSALDGVTDRLLLAADFALNGNSGYKTLLDELIERHRTVIENLNFSEKDKNPLIEKTEQLFDELQNILRGVFLIGDLSQKTSDKIVSYGERLSSLILNRLIEGSQLYDSTKFIKTNRQFKNHIPDLSRSNELIRKTFSEMPPPRIAVVPGFISSSIDDDDITNLGRGGSDYTAAMIAAAMDATMLEIWTDVNGFMTADPKIINSAYVIDELSFIEAIELSNFGAKVIYPPTIFPVYHKNIPIYVRNTFHPEEKGTLIRDIKPTKNGKIIKGISSINDTALITIQGLGMVGVIGVNKRIFSALADNGISVFIVSQASSENSTSIGVRSQDAALSQKVLNKEFAYEISMGSINEIIVEYDLATIAIVGQNMKHVPGIAGKFFGALGRNGISIVALAQGAGETNISCVISKSDLRKSLNVVHDSFFLSPYQELNLFVVGTGTVGGKLLEQIRKQQSTLKEQNKLRINIVGIANGRKALFNRGGIPLENYYETLMDKGAKSSPDYIRDEILKMNIFNSVFVDCTASPAIAELYGELMSRNISVVTANKIAASSDYQNYSYLKETSRKAGVKFLFETNVGAGLPIINTMNSLINSGDRIVKLEAVLSGTLNFIFNTFSEEIPFSKAVRMAVDAQFAEPDPRIDLSGLDVIRKLVILSREAGAKINQSDVKKRLFVPENYFKGTLEEFWKTVPELDETFELRRKELDKQGKKLRFVASYDNGACEVGLREVESGHPFYDLEGSNNIIMITTERYNEYPMVIKGYGAGASVTAAGVFSDIISIANIR
ncbi:MAG TPA: bifunctional aspartate kinase/homoserine dehydrogenase I [Fermentimonas caenicola]|jgi:aspartokinase/homoserine dehydrogenase 1|uniref:Bifunctional aspartokinase I/homoserine dehydrogenase I n=1 Tax=Fermentimonas caenicola TaxID=1562970 RepID=A0A098C209_9BACT|nr:MULTISPECIES: bifunctional aspartate kinase/homoserine dehydrogenase I [Lascolabacillus]MBP6175680.1 bifunctional aspartate kinase/homoserine dehydrogenase I [Fermentimonas sp.]MDI9626503.1 bifunctional aspartate kinase/homoserine dehydrogenase I [Bacteroidota bacterium]TAH60972.1 MAG: bifunctional aspartate kinase/homoserine dehydrogenase I [Fermentimonas caenicola]MBP6197434.1 bifunctional aspartate kinase/homoserine dehydrogenase I [Fermentimonas sp.]MBP7104902.1 bifunctional aspartate k